MKVKQRYCSLCNDFTPHEVLRFYAGVTRGIFAVCTFGMSESILDDTQWKCLKCGKIH